MKHISLRHIGKKLAALSMAAVAAVTLMLSTAPVTANAVTGPTYSPNDEYIPLPAPLYNWKNSQKILLFEIKKDPAKHDQQFFSLADKNGVIRTKDIAFHCDDGEGYYVGDKNKIVGRFNQVANSQWYFAEVWLNALDVKSQSDMTNNQAGRQTLTYLKNFGFYIKNVRIKEYVDPDRSVSRFHVNQLSLNKPSSDSVPLWKYSNKKIVFDFQNEYPTNGHYYGNDWFTVYLQTITPDGHWKGIANSIRINVKTCECTLDGASVTPSGGYYHVELPLNKFTVNNSQIANAATKTLDVVGFDWVNRSFIMYNFRIE